MQKLILENLILTAKMKNKNDNIIQNSKLFEQSHDLKNQYQNHLIVIMQNQFMKQKIYTYILLFYSLYIDK